MEIEDWASLELSQVAGHWRIDNGKKVWVKTHSTSRSRVRAAQLAEMDATYMRGASGTHAKRSASQYHQLGLALAMKHAKELSDEDLTSAFHELDDNDDSYHAKAIKVEFHSRGVVHLKKMSNVDEVILNLANVRDYTKVVNGKQVHVKGGNHYGNPGGAKVAGKSKPQGPTLEQIIGYRVPTALSPMQRYQLHAKSRALKDMAKHAEQLGKAKSGEIGLAIQLLHMRSDYLHAIVDPNVGYDHKERLRLDVEQKTLDLKNKLADKARIGRLVANPNMFSKPLTPEETQ